MDNLEPWDEMPKPPDYLLHPARKDELRLWTQYFQQWLEWWSAEREQEERNLKDE